MRRSVLRRAFNTVPYDTLVPLLVARGYRGPFILNFRYRHALGDPHAWMGKPCAVLRGLLTKRDGSGLMAV